MRDTTLLFLIKREEGKVRHICLAMKKRGFGAGRYNGVGGKLEPGETIEEALIREAEEEVGVQVAALDKCAELIFTFPHNPAFDQLVHVYLSEEWRGDPLESEEMNPSWFLVEDIPYAMMWPDDSFWLPEVIAGNFVNGRFVFGEGDIIQEQDVRIVEHQLT